MSRRSSDHLVQPRPNNRIPEARGRPGVGRTQLDGAIFSDNDQRMLDLLCQARKRERLFPAPTQTSGPPTTVVVAVSGGADSMALLHLLTRIRAAWSLNLVVAHLDHNLRPESADDACFVAEMAERWKLPIETSRLPPQALTQKGNLEATARQWRYRFLAQVAVDHQVDGNPVDVAVAHTANDQAETVLMNLIRGSGLHGLAGMPAVRPLLVQDRPVPGLRVVRPLLDISRSEIMKYLREHNIPWREDSTNQDRTFVRNRVRHEILPLLQEVNPQIVASLCRTASVLDAEVKRSERYTRQAVDTTRIGEGKGATVQTPHASPPTSEGRPPAESKRQIFNLLAFRRLGVADQRAALRAALPALGRPLAGLGFDTVERLRRALCDEDRTGGPYSWVADVMLSRTHDSFSLHHRDATPLVPDHPFLDCSWRARFPTKKLSVPGEIVVEGWTLRSEAVDRKDLPHDWAARSRDMPIPRPGTGKPQLSRWEVYINADAVRELRLSTPRAGQRFEPLGLGGHGKALADYFTDRKVPRFLRPGWPLLLDQKRVVWVGGHQIAHGVRITSRSRRVYHLYWEETRQ